MELLDSNSRADFLADHPDWRIDGETLHRDFDHASFAAAIGFVAAVGVLAEKAFHHPDIDIRYTTVSIALTTHDAGGLTAKDVALAGDIDELR